MIQAVNTFSGFSVNDIGKAKDFYTNVLGFELEDDRMGLQLALPGGGKLFVYEKDDHTPASFTVLSIAVESINNAVDSLVQSGVVFERYDNMPAEQDERGVMRGLEANMGPDIAWFKDPSGNILALLQEK